MNMHTKPNNFPVLSSRTSGNLTEVDRQDIKDFTRDLEDAVQEIGQAAKESEEVNQKVGALMSNMAERNWWGQLTSGLSGGTDKELAIMIAGLGASLVVTQKVVQVVLKVMSQKNQVLHAFNEALVKKIAMVTADTRTLDGNQKVVVKDFLSQLQKQVFDQIQQQELVDSLELRLIDCEAWREEKECHDQLLITQLATQNENQQLATAHIQVLEGNAKALADQTDQLAQHQISDGVRITTLEQQAQVVVDQLAVLDGSDRGLAARVNVWEAKCADLTERVRRLTELLQVNVEQRALISALEQRLLVLEKINNASRMTKARMLRYALVVVASLFGAAAVCLPLVI